MEERIVEFCRQLRARGVPVSPAEEQDALAALERLGVAGLPLWRHALRSALVKRVSDFPLFAELYDAFFLGASGSNGASVAAGGAEVGARGRLADLSERWPPSLSPLTQALLLSAPDEMEPSARAAAGEEAPSAARPRLAAVLDGLGAFRRSVAGRGLAEREREELLAELARRERALVSATRAAAGAGPAVRPRRAEALWNRSFACYSRDEIEETKSVVVELARRIATRLSARRRRRRRGRFDPQATLRANLQHGGVPFRVRLAGRRRERPQLLILCDISDSVLNASRFMLQLVWSFQELYRGVRSFVFVNDLGEATGLFRDHPLDEAVERALKGEIVEVFAHSDLGRALRRFRREHLGDVDSRTTVLILGDGRNNYNPPEAWILGEIRDRARRVVWLNPESRHTWGRGDSDIAAYRPYCDRVEECGNLAQLGRALERWLP
jgi:uncharacterized protein with von Willebrand factor type A (vWA) domain